MAERPRIVLFAAVIISFFFIVGLFLRLPEMDYDAEEMRAMAVMELQVRRLLRLSNLSASSSICRDLQARGIVDPRRQDVAWITAVGDDNYLRPVIVLATTLELFSCVKRRLVLLSPAVSRAAEAKLVKMRFEPIRVEKDVFCENGKLDPSRWHGTFLRFSAFSLTQFRKLLYVDGDFMLLSNIDDIFEYARHPKEVAAAQFKPPMTRDQISRVWADNGFNAGLLLFQPQDGLEDHVVSELYRVGCNDHDQPLLWHVFSQPGWSIKLLPFSYNVRMLNYHPMRAFHFAGGDHMKVWKTPLAESSVRNDLAINAVPRDVAHVFWHYLYLGQRLFGVSVES